MHFDSEKDSSLCLLEKREQEFDLCGTLHFNWGHQEGNIKRFQNKWEKMEIPGNSRSSWEVEIIEWKNAWREFVDWRYHHFVGVAVKKQKLTNQKLQTLLDFEVLSLGGHRFSFFPKRNIFRSFV